MFKSFNWKRPSLVSSLPAEALDTFPAHGIINLLPLCLQTILHNTPCMVRVDERDGGRGRQNILPLPPSSLFLCTVDTHIDTYALEWVTTIRGVSQPHPHICWTPTAEQATTENIPLLWGSSQSHLSVLPSAKTTEKMTEIHRYLRIQLFF